MLEQVSPYNEFSPEYRKQLEDHVRSLGKKVRYRFHIENPNPDPEKYNGPIIWPAVWTLDPAKFRVNDPKEKRDGISKSKQVALIADVDEKGVPNKFKRIRISARMKGILEFNLIDSEGNENYEEFQMVMFLELHPKNKNGLTKGGTETKVFERIDIKAAAVESTRKRRERDSAKEIARNLKDTEVREYAAAMMWDETEDIEVLRDRLEGEAENEPAMFLALHEGEQVGAQATIKRAIDQQVIGIDPISGTVTWAKNGKVIVSLGQNAGNKSDIARLADWFGSGEKKVEAIYKQIQGELS